MKAETIDRANKSSTEIPLASVFFRDALSVTNLDKEWVGSWPELRWKELIYLATKLSDLFTDLLHIAPTEIDMRPVELLDGNTALAGVRIVSHTNIDDGQRRDLQGALHLFFETILQHQDNYSARLDTEAPPSKEVFQAVEEIANMVLNKHPGKRIVAPMTVLLDETRLLVQGRHAALRPAAIKEDRFVMTARIEGFSRRTRTCDLLHVSDKKHLTVAFDIDRFLGNLRLKACDDASYRVTLCKTRDAKGKPIVVLLDIGDPVADQPILSH